jgi:hypothetical protein
MKATNNKLERKNYSLSKGCYILLLVVKNVVLILQPKFDHFFVVSIKRPNPME